MNEKIKTDIKNYLQLIETHHVTLDKKKNKRHVNIELLDIPEFLIKEKEYIIGFLAWCNLKLKKDVADAYLPHLIPKINQDFLEDKEFIFRIVKINDSIVSYVDKRFFDDPEFVKRLFSHSVFTYTFASDRLKNDIKFNKELLDVSFFALKYASEQVSDDRSVVLKAVTLSGSALVFANNRFKDDEEIVRMALEKTPEMFNCISQRLKGQKNIAQIVVGRSGCSLYYVSEALKNDEEIVRAAVNNDVKSIIFASKELRTKLSNDLTVAYPAIEKSGYALEYLSEELRDNVDIVRTALKNTPYDDSGTCLKYASERLKTDPSFALEIAVIKPKALTHFSEALFLDIDRNDISLVVSHLEKMILKQKLHADLPERFEQTRVKL